MFKSTRGLVEVSSFDAIINGLAKDGGLYVPVQIPSLNYMEVLNDDYPTLASKILNLFFNEFSYEEIYKEVFEAYKSFDSNNVIEVKKVGSTYVLELFHGPTLAFKDLALVILPRMMSLSLKKKNISEKLTILTATSGDTGGAALNGFSNIDNIDIVVLYPNNGVSPIQEAQMHSFESKSAHVLAINGNFDDCQSFVKSFFINHRDLPLSSANSINIARLVPQIVYYYKSYIDLLNRSEIKPGENVNFSVPTGNFGDIFAGYLAKKMGLSINKLICASNKNNVLTDFFNTNTYNKNRAFYKTNSPSIDILISSYLERYLYYASNENEELVKELMIDLQSKGEFSFDCKKEIYANFTDEDMTISTIKEVFDNENYLLDPHTAVAYNVYQKYVKDTNDLTKTIILSTASPFKFVDCIKNALGLLDSEDAFSLIDDIENYTKIKRSKQLNYPYFNKTVINLSDLEDYVLKV